MTYRPTVRYDDSFKEYVEKLFHATTLDRNQVHRLALFLLGFTAQGEDILKQHLKPNHTLPSPPWDDTDQEVWREQRIEKKAGGRDVKVDVPVTAKFKNAGGISFQLS